MDKEKKITVLIELSYDTNLKVMREVAQLNREISKQSGHYVTKAKHLSNVLNDVYNGREY